MLIDYLLHINDEFYTITIPIYLVYFVCIVHSALLLFLTQTKKSVYCSNGQNTSESVEKKTSVIGLPKSTIANMAENCHQPASSSKGNMFFEDYFMEA